MKPARGAKDHLFADSRHQHGRARLSRAFGYSITSDAPATLTLSDGRVLHLQAGDNTGTLPAGS